jgi:VWFA-related protein
MTPRVLALSLVAAITTAVSGQQGPTFRAEVEVIQLDAFVTDGAGNPVTNLRVEDFELLEDGKAQTITTFSAVNIPIDAPPPFSPTAPRADVATNGGRDGRFYVIAVDEIDPAMALRARHHLRTFIERHFEPNDVGVVVNVGRASASGAQDVTSDRGLLLAAIDRLRGWPPPLGTPEPPSLPQRRRAAALKALVASLAAIPGRRKALIYLTHDVGDVFDVIDYKGGVRSLEFEDLRAAMTDAMRGGVAIYTMDPCGLAPVGGMIGESFGDAAPYQPLPRCDVKIDRTMNFRMLSSATGGFAVVNSNNFGDAFERIVRENSSYYILGYVSTNDRRDGRYRRLGVRARPPGLTVRTRDGYIAPVQSRPGARAAATTATGIREIMASPLANGAVPMTVFAAPFKGAKGKEAIVLITAELDASRLDLVETEGRRRGSIELAAAAVSAAGKVTRGQPAVMDLSLSAEDYAEVMEQGLRLRASLTLLPGRYQLRVAGGNTQIGKIGSVMYDLDVPDFDKGPLTMSAVAISTTTADPTMSTVEREFARGTRLALYIEVYDNGRGRGPRTIDLKIGVRNYEWRIVQAVGDRRARTARGTETVDVGVPLDMEAGRYVLHVEATSGETTVSRAIPITVR